MKKILLPLLLLISVTTGFAQVTATPKFGCPNTTHNVTINVYNNVANVPSSFNYTIDVRIKTPAPASDTIGSFVQSFTGTAFPMNTSKSFVVPNVDFTGGAMICDVAVLIKVTFPATVTYPYTATYAVQIPPTPTISENPTGTLTVPSPPDAAYTIRYYKDANATYVDESASGTYTPSLSGSYTAKAYEPTTSCISTSASNAIAITVPVVQPTSPATNLTFTAVTATSMMINWTNGNGAKRFVVIKPGAAVNTDPIDGAEPTGNADYTNAPDLGGANYVVYSGSGSTVTVTGLNSSTTYHVEIFEYNGAASTVDVLTSSSLAGSQATSVAAGVREGYNANVSVYPNPMTSLVTISTALSGSLTYELADMNGVVVKSAEFSASTNVNVENLKAGAYVLTVKDKNQKVASYKLMK